MKTPSLREGREARFERAHAGRAFSNPPNWTNESHAMVAWIRFMASPCRHVERAGLCDVCSASGRETVSPAGMTVAMRRALRGGVGDSGNPFAKRWLRPYSGEYYLFGFAGPHFDRRPSALLRPSDESSPAGPPGHDVAPRSLFRARLVAGYRFEQPRTAADASSAADGDQFSRRTVGCGSAGPSTAASAADASAVEAGSRRPRCR